MKTAHSGKLRARILSFVLIALGWVTSGYLLLPHLTADSGVPSCAGCGELLASPSSWQLGYPLAGWGLGYFARVGLLLAWGGNVAPRIALLVGGVGAGVSLVLIAHLLTDALALCPFCLATHAINLCLLASLWLPTRARSAPEVQTGLFAGRTGLVVLAVAVLVGAGLEAALFQPDAEPADALTIYLAEPVEELARPAQDPAMENTAPVVEIRVFTSFQCPGCQAFATTTGPLRERFGDRLRITFHNFPLSTTCNPALSSDMQPRSCPAAWAAEAARLQGQFWPYHDGLFSTDLRASEETLEALARDNGLDLDRWSTDRASPVVRQKVSDDIQLGLDLAIDVTPSVYLNGRRVRQVSLPELVSLIEYELR